MKLDELKIAKETLMALSKEADDYNTQTAFVFKGDVRTLLKCVPYSEFKQMLKDSGYQYGEDAASNAYTGYCIGKNSQGEWNK